MSKEISVRQAAARCGVNHATLRRRIADAYLRGTPEVVKPASEEIRSTYFGNRRRKVTRSFNRPEMVYKTSLKAEYGLTDSLIRQLGEPDEQVSNPHYRSGPPSSLYSVERVRAFVNRNQAAIDKARLSRPKRSAAASLGVTTKVGNLRQRIGKVELRLTQPLPKTYANLRSIASWHAMNRHGPNCREPGHAAVCATVRHEFTNYDDVLRLLKGRIGGDTAYSDLRDRLDQMVEQLIATTYPTEDVVGPLQ